MASEEATQGHLHNLDQIASEPTTSLLDAHCLREAVTYFEAMAAELNEARKLAVNAELRNVRFKAESMRGAVEALRAESERLYRGAEIITQERAERRDHGRQAAHWADWLEQQSASQAQPDPEREVKLAPSDVLGVCWHCKDVIILARPRCESCPAECDDEDCQAEGCEEQQAASQPLENIEGLTQSQPCRASQTAMMRAELANRITPAKPEKEKP